jgi:hypothetical protein
MRDDLHQLGERIAEQTTHIDAALHRLLTDLRVFDEANGGYEAGAMSCAHWLAWRVNWAPGTAREHVRVARCLGALPLIDDALRRGEVSFSKVRALTRVATSDNEATLLEHARNSTAAQLERICQKLQAVQRLAAADPAAIDALRQVTRRSLDDGMVKLEAVLRPEEAALVWAAIEAAADHRADGLVALARGAGVGDGGTGRDTVPAASLACESEQPGIVSTFRGTAPAFPRARPRASPATPASSPSAVCRWYGDPVDYSAAVERTLGQDPG